MSKQASLKNQLKEFLLNPNKKGSSITLEAVKSKQVQISDSNRYYFASKNLKKQLKLDGVKSKQFYIKLKKWKFVQTGKNQIDLDIQDYTILKKNADLIHAKNKDLLDYQEIRNLMEEIQQEKPKTPVKVRASKSKVAKSQKQTPIKKKIEKKTSKAEKTSKSIRSKKTTPFKTIPKLAARPLSSSNIYQPQELIFAEEFKLHKRPHSVSVPRKLTGAKEFNKLSQNFQTQVLMDKQSKMQFDIELQKNRQTSNLKIRDDKISSDLTNHPVTYEEILHGIETGLISWKEINVNYQVISKIMT